MFTKTKEDTIANQRMETEKENSTENVKMLALRDGINEMFEKQPKENKESCTFAHTKSGHVKQHWYFCYSCLLVGNKGCCSVCAKRCHAGHDVAYASNSSFFCDCGDG